MKKIQIRVFKDGHIESETVGIKGKSCLNYIKQIEDLTGAKTIKSQTTAEYNETQENTTNNICNEGYQSSGY